jgi:hypothetical protein
MREVKVATKPAAILAVLTEEVFVELQRAGPTQFRVSSEAIAGTCVSVSPPK